MSKTMLESGQSIAQLVSMIRAFLERHEYEGSAEVLGGIDRWFAGEPVPHEPRQVRACRQLRQALAAMIDRPLADAIAAAAPNLVWTTYDAYPLAEIGEAFAEGHAFASLIGEGAPYEADGFDLGLFLIEPHMFYRDHHHAAPELYLPLTGPHGWRFAPGETLSLLEAHQPVWNTPWRPHATKVGTVPFLCIFAWTADVNQPACVIHAADWADLDASRDIPKSIC